METMYQISYICSYVLNTLMHLFLNVNIKKIKNIKNKKYCTHSCIHALTSLLARFIMRPTWCGHDLNLNFLKIPFRPYLHVKVLTSLKNIKTRENKFFLEKKINHFLGKKERKSVYNDYKKHIHIFEKKNKYIFVNTLSF